MKNILMKSCALVLSGTCLVACYSCLKEKNDSEKFTRLDGKYGLEGYYLADTPFEGLYVIEVDGKLKIIDERRNFVTSDGRWQKNKDTAVYELYHYLNKDLVNIKELSKADYIELEEYINGNTNVTFVDNAKEKCNDHIAYEGRYYYKDRDIYYFNADSERIEILFLDGKASRIVRRLEYGLYDKPEGKTEDIISGTIVNLNHSEPDYVSFDSKMMEQYGNKGYEYISLSSYFNDELKEEFTGEEIKDLYFQIEGKTKKEVEGILSKSNINDIEKTKKLEK